MYYLAAVTEDLDTFLHIPKQKGRLVLTRSVLADFSNLHHLPQFVEITSNQIQKGQLVEVLRPLIAHLNDLMVA